MNTVIENVSNIYHKTQLNGVIDVIIDALMSVVNAIVQTIFQPVLYFVYEVVIWTPLQVINALDILFKFFAAGFANQIFGGQLNPNGTISYTFSFSSPLGLIMMYVLILSFILFFLYFLLGFIVGQNKGLGSFLALKWPLIMVLALTLTPPILIIADSFMGALLSGMDGTAPRKLSTTDVQNLHAFFINDTAGSSADFNQLITMQSSCSGVFGALNSVKGLIDEAMDKIHQYSSDDDYSFGIISTYLQDAQNHINTIQTYLNSGLQNDFNATLTMVNSWQPGAGGMFISDANAAALSTVSENLTALQMTFNLLKSDLAHLNLSECAKGWKTLTEVDTNITKDAICGPLTMISNSLSNLDSHSELGYYLGIGKSTTGNYSLVAQMISTTTNYPSLANLFWYRPITAPSKVVETLYQLITGDTNPNNWFVLPEPWSGSILGTMSIFQWIAGTFALWGMILVMYSFTGSAIKRTYYIIGYWVIGFFYLANAQKDQGAAIKWYKMIWGKWIGVLVMYILYTIASSLVSIISDAIVVGLSDQSSYTFGGVNLLVFFGIMLAIEAAYQTAYQISQAYMGEFGAKDEQFQTQSPLSLLSEGSSLFSKTLSNAEYYATGGPVKDAYNKVEGYKKYWQDKSDTKASREQAQWGKATRAADQDKTLQLGKDAGYDFQKRGDTGLEFDGGNGKPYGGTPPPAAAAAAGGAAAPAAGGAAAAAAPAPAAPAPAAPAVQPRVRVPSNFVDYRSSSDPTRDSPVDHWYQGENAGARLKNIGRAIGSGVARLGDAAIDFGAAAARKTGIAGAAIGLAGLIGGDRAAANATRAFGDSNNRMSNAEKQFARHSRDAVTGAPESWISKNRTTGDVTIEQPMPPGANRQTNSTLLMDGSIGY